MGKLKVLDLFSGIGGFSLGLEMTGGFETVAFCEIEKDCHPVLNRHWPGVPIYEDIKELTYERLREDGVPRPQVLCGGFPCQDISTAGRGDGIKGARSGLWSEMRRLVGSLRPDWVCIENVSALRSRGLNVVLNDLHALGYNAEWNCLSATSTVSAPHQRDRIWVIAFPDPERSRPSRQGEPVASVHPATLVTWETVDAVYGCFSDLFASEPNLGMLADGLPADLSARVFGGGDGRDIQLPRVAEGIPKRVAKLKQLGNAVVPQVVAIIGMAILGKIQSDEPYPPTLDMDIPPNQLEFF